MKHLLLVVPALALSGCISFGAKPPPTLLTLAPAQQLAVGTVQTTAGAKTIVVQVPATSTSLSTVRVPVQATPTTLAYLKGAAWAEPPARLFARLVADTLTAGGTVVLSGVQSIDSPAANLAGELRNFGVDATTREAVVTFDAALTRGQQGVVEKRRFEARVPLAVIDAASVGPALNDAANKVATEVAGWAGR